MTTGTMFADLLAAQKEMPALQKSGINPHFKNRYVPLDELLQAVVPILNSHNFVLMQSPVIADGPALQTVLIHTSGERIESTMALLCAKDDPQGQGSAITYARRYSLMGLLGLSADLDDDAAPKNGSNGHIIHPPIPRAAPPNKPQETGQPVAHATVPKCPNGHGPMRFWPAETTKSGKSVGARYKCATQGCENDDGYRESVWFDAWDDYLRQQAQLALPK